MKAGWAAQWARFKGILSPQKYRLKRAEARISQLEKQISSLQAQFRDLVSHQTPYLKDFRGLMAPLQPWTAKGRGKIREGGANDGGYVMLDDFDGIDTAISLGIGKEVSWDLAIAARGIRVLQFDPTVSGPPVAHPSFVFRPLAVVGRMGDPTREITLDDILAGAGSSNLILKIDIEGAEWEVFDVLPDADFARFTQILVEFHDLHRYRDAAWRERAGRVFAKIVQSHRLIHVHGNNYNATFAAGMRECPRDLEMTFVRSDRCAWQPSRETFPTPLDRPNKPSVPDYELGDFRFE